MGVESLNPPNRPYQEVLLLSPFHNQGEIKPYAQGT